MRRWALLVVVRSRWILVRCEDGVRPFSSSLVEKWRVSGYQTVDWRKGQTCAIPPVPSQGIKVAGWLYCEVG